MLLEEFFRRNLLRNLKGLSLLDIRKKMEMIVKKVLMGKARK